MAYGDFSLPTLLQKFDLQLVASQNYFAESSPVLLTPEFLARMIRQTDLAVAISTEKARSELVIAPILLEALERVTTTVSFFSGIELNAAPELGLNGVCDFLFSLSANQMLMTAPIVVIVEAKNDTVRSGFEQCIAEMVAVRIYNEKKGRTLSTYYGISTTGTSWVFMRLTAQTVFIDKSEHYINEPEKLVGIVVRMIEEAGREWTTHSNNGK